MSQSRRPSVVSIYNYPEHLNPFKEGDKITQSSIQVENKSSTKEPKHKFWTFGRSKKKRSNSFSIKSKWNGLFGKHKEPEAAERRTTITTVSTSYQNGQNVRPVVPPRLAKDHHEFDEALGTLTRRRKYTWENSSGFGSNLTVNGDPARLYNGSPQETTASIMGETTPKPPARRFGQVSPRPKDKIPPLELEEKDEKENESIAIEDGIPEQTPVPPRRFGQRSSLRLNASTPEEDESLRKSSNLSVRDENENLAEEYVFRRCNTDAVRRSNLSINSCVSTASGISTIGRKKRRAPQPPQRKEHLESPEEKPGENISRIELQITEPIDIARVTEDIEEMTKQNQDIDKTMNLTSPKENCKATENSEEASMTNKDIAKEAEAKSKGDSPEECIGKSDNKEIEAKPNEDVTTENIEADNIEIRKVQEEKLEIITDIDADDDSDDVELRNKSSSLSRSDSFSVKEEIEKIERQIKELETKNANDANQDGLKHCESSDARLSIQANRRSFFQNMVTNDPKGVKIEIKELPREQKQIQIVKLTDAPIPIDAPKDPVKIVTLHISEPIKQVPELIRDVNINPLPKPRRHSSQSVQGSPMIEENKFENNTNDSDTRDRRDSL